MHVSRGRRRRAFSLIELIIVVVIIGILAAIAIPRMSRGAAGAADSALTGSLAVLRNALDLYAAEHISQFPAQSKFEAQMTLFSDEWGNTSAAKGGAFIFGPYLQAVPPVPVGARKGSTGVASADGPGVGWIYVETTGKIRANTTTEADASGKLYSDY
jgi:prepilin-type N-terminal cleavage/methylation domain-containing protein